MDERRVAVLMLVSKVRSVHAAETMLLLCGSLTSCN